MKPDEARTLATRLCQGWPKGLSATAWEDAISDLDSGAAGTTFARLQATVIEPTGPTVATFLALYHTLDTRRPEHHPDCHTCNGHGWQYQTTTDPDGIEHIHGVHPCHCPHGRQYDEPHRNAINHNNNELARLGLTRRNPR